MTIRQAVAKEKLQDLDGVLNHAEVLDIETMIEIEELQDKMEYDRRKKYIGLKSL